MAFSELPPSAAWQHRGARDGFESVFVLSDGPHIRLEGHTTAVEAGVAWALHYAVSLDRDWVTRTAHIEGWSTAGHRKVVLEADGAGTWQVDGRVVPELDGCLDVDLEASACTNTFPIHRLRLGVGDAAEAPAAYVGALDLAVVRLEQHYVRVEDDGEVQQFDYRAPSFDFEALLAYDRSGLVLEYPGIARRLL